MMRSHLHDQFSVKTVHQKQEHTRSYYAATANEITDYPVLEGATSADVCVVGAGFTGVATALTLAERGYSVALVEANRVGWGASGRNGGQLINGIVYDRVEKYAIDCDLKSGFVETALKPRQLAYIEEHAQERDRLR